MKLKWYHYNQSNSGGYFLSDDYVAQHVFIQAPSEVTADAMAEHVGIYFDGSETGQDCECCGDRWTSAYDISGLITYIYKDGIGYEYITFDDMDSLAQAKANDSMYGYPNENICIVYYADGTVKRFKKTA